MAGIVRRYPLTCFFVAVYGITWLFWLPYALSEDGLGWWHFRFPEVLGDTQLAGLLVGGYLGPFASAFAVTALADGVPGLRRWRARLFRWRIAPRWYLFSVLGIPLVLLAGSLVLTRDVHRVGVSMILLYLGGMVLQMLTSSLAEEPGWRDFALPRLQARHGPLLGTVILGPLWAWWHLPLFLTTWNRGGGGLRAIALFTLLAVAFSVVITWAFNRTGESLPVAMLIHASNNNTFSVLTPVLLPGLVNSEQVTVASLIGYGVLAVVLVIVTRGRLGYPGPVPGRTSGPGPGSGPAADRAEVARSVGDVTT
ncbi:CPBP family intramembrane glutamic endopeptidase [Cryptosporangium phraense]|uniref:CPBP family intramembrane metalloprotease n=1 Tax=Cryptosporangium phraense TaxID=2593070 RepID=A0A545AXV8_9ACTN|nr:type II CAAX endopeptidase family protein [Cryptosporangium phraense]TQS46160.1 CPBP family intramembrane metalloprotease [Cryptosporangium phraense]